MRQTVYKCDECKKEIGEKRHISLQYGQYSGIAIPSHPIPYTSPNVVRWSVEGGIKGTFAHFCNAQCLQRFFSVLMKKATVESPF